MKKIATLSVALIAIAFASCAKERTCTCITSENEQGTTSSEKTIVYKKITKSNAKAACMSIIITPDGAKTNTGDQLVETRTCTLQ